MKHVVVLFCALLLVLFASVALAAKLAVHAAPEGSSIYIISPADGEHVSSPVTIVFGLEGMGIAPSGVERPKTGHHHLLVDVDALPAAGQPIPSDAHHLHFGGGQTQTTLELQPGTHTLQLELGDLNHVPFEPPVVSPPITIYVD